MGLEIKDVMSENVATSKSSLSLSEAAKLLDKYHVDYLVIVEKGKIAGIFTTDDMKKCVSDNCNAFETTIKEVMTKKVITIDSEADINEAVEIMKKNNIKRLPVLEGGELVGIISASHIALAAPSLLKEIAEIISSDPETGFAQ